MFANSDLVTKVEFFKHSFSHFFWISSIQWVLSMSLDSRGFGVRPFRYNPELIFGKLTTANVSVTSVQMMKTRENYRNFRFLLQNQCI